MTPEEILAEEASGRKRAGFAALTASVLTVLGVALTTLGQPGTSEFDDNGPYGMIQNGYSWYAGI